MLYKKLGDDVIFILGYAVSLNVRPKTAAVPILVFGTNLNSTQVKCTSGNSDIEVCVCVF